MMSCIEWPWDSDKEKDNDVSVDDVDDDNDVDGNDDDEYNDHKDLNHPSWSALQPELTIRDMPAVWRPRPRAVYSGSNPASPVLYTADINPASPVLYTADQTPPAPCCIQRIELVTNTITKVKY
ncbi:hypothetical protein DPMN_027195 [Dreissena polymorpha]|uniref:Uncharacterized protein n=1 Tax=Dreissena polymorpha TaxID=45954 RepID=A0A9D4RDE5_DREPO|nr:hypothetical protein DPMN_027195 [Dreissena polymorpha]